MNLENLIEITKYPVNLVLSSLLKDKTTSKNIIFATNAYNSFDIDEHTEITRNILLSFGENLIQPRVLKSAEEQNKRTRNKAEVFTPSWICNRMNNHCDEEWFNKKNIFNTEKDKSWVTNKEKIQFTPKDAWKKYVISKRLEITCGEAPYLVSRYDASTGEKIPVSERIGILDRKLRVVSENTTSEKEWKKWAYKAYRSVYGYEFQGDNLLIARINLLVTFVDYMYEKFARKPSKQELLFLSRIIVWNLWQMDGITGTVPFFKSESKYPLLSFFETVQGLNDCEEEKSDCKIYDWDNKQEISFNSIKENKK